MTDRRTQDMPAREIEAVLSPLPTTRPSGYSFINERRRPARPVIDEVTVPKEPREAAPSPEVALDPRPITLDLKDAPTLEPELDPFFLSDEVRRVLRMPPAELCPCASLDELIGDIFTGSDDGRFVVLQSLFGKDSGIIQRLTADQAARALMKLAIRRCPFEGTVMDGSLDFEPWMPTPGEPPICCAWMAHAVMSERVRFPRPGETLQHAWFITKNDTHSPFYHCPRCPAEMHDVIRARRAFFTR